MKRDTIYSLAFLVLVITLVLIANSKVFPQSRPNIQKLGDSNNNSVWYAQGIYGASAGVKIQAALDSVSSSGGQIVAPFIGAQTITDTIVISKSKVHINLGAATFTLSQDVFLSITGDDVTLEGTPNGTLLYAHASSVTPTISVTGDRVTIKNLSIRAPNTSNAVQVIGGDDFKAENITIDRGNYGFYTNNSTRFTVRDCRIDSTYRTSIWVDSLCHHPLIENNTITKSAIINSGAHASIKVVGAAQREDRGARILNNNIDSAMVLGIGVNSKGGAYLTSDVTIMGNVVRNTLIGGGGSDGEGISFTLKNSKVIGNEVYNSGASGILLFGTCENVSVMGNTGGYNTNHAIQVVCDPASSGTGYGDGQMKGISLTGNIGYDVNDTTGQNSTVQIKAIAGGNIDPIFPIIVSGNTWNGNSTGAIGYQADSLKDRTIDLANATKWYRRGGLLTTSGTSFSIASDTTFDDVKLMPGMWLRSRSGTAVRKIATLTTDSTGTLFTAFSPNLTSVQYISAYDNKTVEIQTYPKTTPMVLSYRADDGTQTEALRLWGYGTGAQLPYVGFGSNELYGMKMGHYDSFYGFEFDHRYSGARYLSFKLRGIETIRTDTAATRFYSGGTLVATIDQYGFTSTKNPADTVHVSTGGRTITFSTAYPSTAYSITAICKLSDGTPVPFFITSKTAAGFTVTPGADNSYFDYITARVNQ